MSRRIGTFVYANEINGIGRHSSMGLLSLNATSPMFASPMFANPLFANPSFDNNHNILYSHSPRHKPRSKEFVNRGRQKQTTHCRWSSLVKGIGSQLWVQFMLILIGTIGIMMGCPDAAIALDSFPAPPPSPAPQLTTDIQTISWAFTANRYRNRIGDDITVFCPENGVANRVWGSDVYSDQSSVCTAAVHAGLITFEAGGAIAIRILPGQEDYVGSTQNDLTSSSFSNWPGSFTFITLRDTVAGVMQPADGVGIPIQIVTWQSTAEPFSAQRDQHFSVYCPAFGTLSEVWGSDIYRDASSICTAAVHAGRMTTQSGGAIAFTTSPAMPFYIGNTRNGITSRHWQGGESSFQFLDE
ncbi:MAG: LCCL domain-containing protein [Cyanobacteria bacterium P01_A01_bin.37]